MKCIKNYRKMGLFLVLAGACMTLQAQVPNGINYQAMALDTAGNPLQNQTIGIRMGIVEQNSSNAPVYQETHALSTDASGIFSLQIGMGTATINTMDSVDWANSPVYLKVEIDRNGGANYSLIGFTEFFTVPYAFKAAYGADEDADPANELQSLSLQSGALSISDGNTVDLQSELLTFDVNRVLFADGRNNTGFSVPIDSTTAAANNTAFGHGTGNSSMSGNQNSLLGHRAGQSLTSGYANTYLGSLAGQKSTTAYGNVALGNGAGEKNLSGQHNVFVGDQAGKNALGAYNTIVGKSAGYSLTTGTNNVFVGTNAGVYNQVGHSNVFIGKDAGFNETGSNRLYIDNSNTSSPLIHGKFDTNELTVNGDLDITGNITQNGGPLSVNPDDNDSTNELQTLALNGHLLSISSGNDVTLPDEIDGDTTNELQTLSLAGNVLSISETNSITLPESDDSDSTNELQTLALVGRTLSISDGNSLLLPDEVDGDSTNELQTLSLAGNTLSLSNTNSVQLPSNSSSVGLDVGIQTFNPSGVNQEITITHNLGSVPAYFELNWYSHGPTNNGEATACYGNGIYTGSEYSSVTGTVPNTPWAGMQQSHLINSSIIYVLSHFRGFHWSAIVTELTSTHIKLKVNSFSRAQLIRFNWKAVK